MSTIDIVATGAVTEADSVTTAHFHTDDDIPVAATFDRPEHAKRVCHGRFRVEFESLHWNDDSTSATVHEPTLDRMYRLREPAENLRSGDTVDLDRVHRRLVQTGEMTQQEADDAEFRFLPLMSASTESGKTTLHTGVTTHTVSADTPISFWRTFSSYACPFRPGQQIIVPRGSLVHTTAPDGDYRLSRKQTVTLDHVFDGYPSQAGYPGSAPEIGWAGSSGYWRRVKVTPEMIEANAALAGADE